MHTKAIEITAIDGLLIRREQPMLQKLLLAVTITFVLNLFLEIRLPASNQTAAKVYPGEMPTVLLSKMRILGAE